MLYNEKINAIKTNINYLKTISNTLEDTLLLDKLNNIISNIENDSFKVLIVGQFSRGKSTFINALVGERILPSSFNPTTTIITKIKYGQEKRVFLYFKDNSEPKEITFKEFKDIVATDEVDDDISELEAKIQKDIYMQNISLAEVSYPLEFCKNGVEIIDTPGTNDLSEIRVDITYNYLDKADAVIMILSASQILNISEVEFLKQRILKNHITDIFYVINKKDTLLTIEEEKRVYDYLQRNLYEILPDEVKDNIKIYLVSSMQGLLFKRQLNGEKLNIRQKNKVPETLEATGFISLEKDLFTFLDQDKGHIKISLYIRRLMTIIHELSSKVENKIELNSSSLAELKDLQEKLLPQIKLYRTKFGKALDTFYNKLEVYKINLNNEIDLYTGELLIKLKNGIQEYNGNLNADNISEYINFIISQDQIKFILNIEEFQKNLIDTEYRNLQDEMNKIFGETFSKDTRVLAPIMYNRYNYHNQHVSFGNISLVDKERGDAGFIFGGLTIGFLTGGALLPALLLGGVAAYCFHAFDDRNRIFKEKVLEKLVLTYPKYCSNLKEKMLKNFDNDIEALKQQIIQDNEPYLVSIESDIKKTIEEKALSSVETQSVINNLKSLEEELNKVKSNISLLLPSKII